MTSKRHLLQRSKHLQRNRRAVVAIALVLVVLAYAGVAAYAKYAHQATDDRTYAANNFYFSSDFLSEKGQTYTLSAGTTQLSIELHNYDDVLRWSDDVVEYSYEVTLQADDGSEYPFASGSGTIAHSAGAGSSSAFAISGLTAGTYKVTATSTSPFAKTLTGTFTIPAESNDVGFTVSDSVGSPYAQLTVRTEAYTGDIIVSWSADVYPDTTQPAFKGVGTYDAGSGAYQAGSCSVGPLGKFGSATYRFFKADPQANYSTDASIGSGAGAITATASN